MIVNKSVSVAGQAGDVCEGVRAYFLGSGYEEFSYGEHRLEFRKRKSWRSSFGYRIEQVPANLTIDLVPWQRSNGEPSVRLAVSYDVKTKFRLLSRLDSLYFEMELEDLEGYLETGKRRRVAGELDEVRTPIAMTAISNTLLTGALVATAGLLVRMQLSTVVPIAVGVSLINFVSIVGFADIIVDGMDRLSRTR